MTADLEVAQDEATDDADIPPAPTTQPAPARAQLIERMISEARRVHQDASKGDPARLAELVLELFDEQYLLDAEWDELRQGGGYSWTGATASNTE